MTIRDPNHQFKLRKNATGLTPGTIRVAGRLAAAGNFLRNHMNDLNRKSDVFFKTNFVEGVYIRHITIC